MSRGASWAGALVLVLVVSCCLSATALALPEGRVYEMVSPPYKGGYGASAIEAVAPTGESVAFYSPGAFEGAPSSPEGLIAYVAHRGATGWSTAPLMVPATMMPYIVAQDVSSSLDSTLALGKPGSNEEGAGQAGTEEEFRLHLTDRPDTEANWELGGVVLRTLEDKPLTLIYHGASADFCHILFTNLGREALLPQAAETTEPSLQIYELDRGCSGGPTSLRLLGVNNQGKSVDPACAVDVGIGGHYASEKENEFNAIAADGTEIFFTTNVDKATKCANESGDHQLFVRLDGAKTLEVSKSVAEECNEVPCEPGAASRASANFVGASEDGSRVFFTTTQSYVASEDKDTENDLYMATIGCPSGNEHGCEAAEREVKPLVQVSHDPNGEAAQVQGVVRVAPDGSRVYFVASGDLLSQAEQEGIEGEGRAVPHAKADNLYVYDSVSGKVAFVADLCSGSELSGAVVDVRCPSTTGSDERLWLSASGASGPEAQTAGTDGRFLVFSSYGQLVSSDTDTAKDIYRYDAETGALDRVSLGEAGSDANGNNSLFDATIALGNWGGKVARQYEMGNRAMTEDGSRIVFTTAEPLLPAAINHLTNVYEWHKEADDSEGRVSLISSGSAEEPVEDVVISPKGDDVFFVTVQGLVSQDTDGAPDIYDARLPHLPGEQLGFSVTGAKRQQCLGDACQGPLTNPAPLLVPGSVPQAPGGNFAAPVSKPAVKAKKPKPKPKPKKKRQKKGKASGRSGKAKKAAGRSRR
jgi:hypothetical protein